ncbi:hypothetical protein [Stenotrophomonas sp. SY1]|uniref:hypothetical protein n=1 Tax=Stenotrophomonas sp. SY1 TaxID=477235 RepID=UPI001E44C536|nr:hypothetical protein [Stenotrophomonas sp. SY1]MCD9085376.1 hypothetical protein [Stenotrophomonas sp. SY1]
MLLFPLRRPFTGRLPRVLVALLAMSAMPAMAASTLACGSYNAVDGGARLVVESSGQAEHRYEGQPPIRYLIRQQGQTLHAANISSGYTDSYTLSADGKRITATLADYVLDAPARCSTAPAPVAGSCRADIDSCIESASSASPQLLKQWCQEDLPFACNALLASYEKQAQQQGNDIDPELEEPEVCKEKSPLFNENACREAAREVLGKALGKAFADALSGAEAVLADAPLGELLQLCRQQPDAGFCEKVADAHWNAGHFLAAGQALQLACRAGGDERTCQRASSVLALDAGQFRAAPASTLPCGDYAADTGLMSELSFGDQGLVTLGMGSEMRARLENGNIHIRHDKGGDFVFKPLTNGGLLGLDRWNRYAVYARTGGASHCTAPVTFIELPLPQDCPTGDAQACCDAGKLQGCNAMGHRKALAGDWQAAAPYYLKLCQVGVRAGCENLRSVYEHTEDEDLPGKLLWICNRDGKGTHVACDVYATTNWALLGLGAQLQRAADEIEADVETDAAPDTGKANRK